MVIWAHMSFFILLRAILGYCMSKLSKSLLRQTYERYIFKFVLDNFLFIFKKNIGTTELVYVGSIPTLGIHLYWLVQSGQFSLVAPHWLCCSYVTYKCKKIRRPSSGLAIFIFLFENQTQQNHWIIVKIIPQITMVKL